MEFTNKVRAALWVGGFIKSQEASDEVCEAACTVICGADIPADETKLVGLIQAKIAGLENPAPVVGGDGASTPAPAQGDKLDADSIAAIVRKTEADERHRVRDIRARGQLLGASVESIDKAIDDGVTAQEACVRFADSMAAGESHINSPTITPGISSQEKFIQGAVEVMVDRSGYEADQSVLNGVGASLRQTRLVHIAQQEMQFLGMNVSGMNEEQIAQQYLQLPGVVQTPLVSGGGLAEGYGRHPDLMSAYAYKILEKGYAEAAVSFEGWCERIEDLPDFEPRTFIETGVFGELNERGDKEPVTERLSTSLLSGVIQKREYSDAAGMTVRMIQGDKLRGLAKQLMTFPAAGKRTLNHMCIKAAVSSANMIDGSAMYSTGNRNLATTAAAPSETTMDQHRLLHRQQRNYGDPNTPIGVAPSIALFPAALEGDGLRSCLTMGQLPEVKNPTTDATINTTRGMCTPLFDAYLDQYSTTAWYTFLNPMQFTSPVAYAYGTGYSGGGRRETWYDPKTKVRYFSYTEEFAACRKSRLGVVKNAGA